MQDEIGAGHVAHQPTAPRVAENGNGAGAREK
jgi:hypothetical protein